MSYNKLFENLKSEFKEDLKSAPFFIAEDFKVDAHYYKNKNFINISFYYIAAIFSEKEKKLEELRKYIWNKNNADIILIQTEQDKWRFLYGKCNPNKINLADSTIGDTFSISELEKENFERIKRYRFDNGAFWLKYADFLEKAKKYKKIDKDLVETLDKLRTKLFKEINNEEKVQALIDRTLYIKFLEDNHIINSVFNEKYFEEKDCNSIYKILLQNVDKDNLNKLFNIIHEIFNNDLFDNPKIEDKFLNKKVCDLIYQTISGTNLETGQLSLFDFQFNVLPIELISYIYEIFLSEKQKSNGIFYTPRKLAQLIVDDVITENKLGKVLDPACGSGMFLATAFDKLLEISNEDQYNGIEKIKHRTKILAEYIFGIEKEPIAKRFTLFSLYLHIFKEIEAQEIKNYIADKLNNDEKINLFSEFDFYKNIICQNTLDIENQPFRNKEFDYIVGNPPFTQKSDVSSDIISFLKNYDVELSNNNTEKAEKIVGSHQISQCFLLKIKDWSNKNTRFGFVSNSSNFYNDNSDKFQEYFYSNYEIEKIYELSRVKNILFEKAKENVVSIVFNNKPTNNNTVKYYPIDLGLFSEKPFELLIIQEDNIIFIEQEKLRNKILRLRDFLVGNEYDRKLVQDISKFDTLNIYLLKDKNYSSFKGLTRVSNAEVTTYFNINTKINKKELENLHNKFASEKYLSNLKTDYYNTPHIFKPEEKISAFSIKVFDGFMNKSSINKTNFQRPRNLFIYEGNKIIVNRFGEKLQAVYVNYDVFFSNFIYGIKLQNIQMYPLVVAILNSDLLNYYILHKYKNRNDGNFPNINTATIKNIPIPKDLDEDLVAEISKISKELTEGKYKYSEKETELNELIFDLYELSYTERQRIKDYFLPKQEINRSKTNPIIDNYKTTLTKLLNFYLKNPIGVNDIEFSNDNFKLLVAKISLKGANPNSPTPNQVQKSILDEIISQDPNAKILTGQEKIFTTDCIYIVKTNNSQNWTATKAFEDREEILKRLNYN